MQGTIFLHLSPQFQSPPFSPLPPCSMPDYHHPHYTSPFTTPHHTAQHHTHTAQRCTTSAYPFGFGQCCRYAPHHRALSKHLKPPSTRQTAPTSHFTTTHHNTAH